MRVAWFSYFPVEWIPDAPPEITALSRLHPAPWQRVLAEELALDPGLELHVIALRKDLPRDVRFRWRGITFHVLRVPGGLRAPTLFWVDTLAIKRCLRVIQPDLVHAWGTEKGAALVATRLPYPFLVTMQGLMNWIAERVPVNLYERFAGYVERRALRRARTVTTESRFAVDYLKSHHPHLEVLQVEHAPHPLFGAVERRPAGPPIHFLFVGAFTHLKGLDLLVRSLDRLRPSLQFRATLVGGPRKGFFDQVRSRTPTAIWERIEVREGLTAEGVAAEMARATLLLFPTRADTSPNAVKEAVVAGLPVVASAVGGIVDYVLPGRNGVLFPPGDLDAFCEAIRRAVELPMFREGRVDPVALAEMREYLSPRKMAAAFASAYRRVAAGG